MQASMIRRRTCVVVLVAWHHLSRVLALHVPVRPLLRCGEIKAGETI